MGKPATAVHEIFFEDIKEGHEFVTAGRTVTETDIVQFAGLSGDYNRLHMDEAWVLESTPFRGRIAHGLLGAALTSGLYSEYLYDWQILAFLECTRRFKAPAYIGDTLHAEYRVTETRRSRSRPGSGVVAMDLRLLNQDDVLLQEGVDVCLLACRDGG